MCTMLTVNSKSSSVNIQNHHDLFASILIYYKQYKLIAEMGDNDCNLVSQPVSLLNFYHMFTR